MSTINAYVLKQTAKPLVAAIAIALLILLIFFFLSRSLSLPFPKDHFFGAGPLHCLVI